LKKRWPKRWQDFRSYYLVLTPGEKRVIAFICAAFLLGLTTKCYRDKNPQSVPYVDPKHPSRKYATPPPSTAKPKRSRKPRASVTPSPSPNETMSILQSPCEQSNRALRSGG
jgi:hypothetical protein